MKWQNPICWTKNPLPQKRLSVHGKISCPARTPSHGSDTKVRLALPINRCRKSDLEKRTTFTGFLDHQSKLQALVDASVVVLPSRSEVFAITALETLACRKPVLLSSECGLFPTPGTDCGVWRFENENVSDLAIRLAAILNSDASSPSEAGRDFVIREFCPERIAERAEAIYEEAIRRG